MSLRLQLIVAVSAVTTLTLGGAFLAVFFQVNASQLDKLDSALIAKAHEETSLLAEQAQSSPILSDGPGPSMHDMGFLTKYAALYRSDGQVLAQTASFQTPPPALSLLPKSPERAFNLWHQGQHLRAVLMPLSTPSGASLLMASPRAELDGDERFLARAMMLVFLAAVLWAVLVAIWVVKRLTAGHQTIAQTARQVAAGNLSARVHLRRADPEIRQLGQDINEMIERLSLLVASQQRFVAHAAHELRSPLTTLYGELSFALRRQREAEEYRRVIEESLDSTKRLKSIAEQLLTLAKMGAESPQSKTDTDLRQSLEEAWSLIAQEAESRSVTIEISGPSCSVKAAPHDLPRLFRNLLENALRHSPIQGQIQIHLDPQKDWALVSIQDQGPGIAKEDRERVFEPFFRGAKEQSEQSPGAGLGLPIAKEIASRVGGELWLGESEKGAKFYVRLPL